MADRDLTINLKILKTAAETASKEFHAAEKKRIDKTLSDFEVAEKAKSAIVARENRQRIQEAVRAHKTAIDQAAERARAEKAGNQAIAVALRQAAAEEKRIKREAAREDARLQRELVARYKANYRERQKEKKEQAAETKRLLKEEQEAWNANEGAILGGVKAVGAFALGMAGLNSASAVVGEVDAAFQRMRDSVFESTNLLHDYRETLLELAALKGHMGDTSAEMLETLKLQGKTGQRDQDVRAFQESFLGLGESAIGRTITRADATKVMEGLGQIQAVQGGGASAFGELGGLLMQMMKGKNGGMLAPEDVVNEGSALYELTQPGGFRNNVKGGVKQFGKAAPFIQSGVVSPRQAMAMISALSIAEPDNAGQRFQQVMAATVGALGKNSKVRGDEESNNIGTAEYLKSLGIDKNETDPVKIMRRIQADLSAQKADATAKGGEFNPYAYLQSKGYGNRGTMNAVLNFGGMLESGAYKPFEDMANDPNLGKGRIEEARKKLATDVTFQRRMSKSAAGIADMASGAGRDEIMESVREAAYVGLKSKNDYYAKSMPSFAEIEKSSALSPSNIMFGYKRAVNLATQDLLRSQAAKNGIEVDTSAVDQWGQMTQDEQFRLARGLQAKRVNFGGMAMGQATGALEGNMQAAGMVDPANQAGAKLLKAADKLGAVADKLGGNRPAPLAAKPQQPRAAPVGAAGFN